MICFNNGKGARLLAVLYQWGQKIKPTILSALFDPVLANYTEV